MSNKADRRRALMATIQDLIGGFLYYDRKEDDTLPLGMIEHMIEFGEVTQGEIIKEFTNQINKAFDKIEVKTPTLF